jgi:hypothetical protein
LKTFAHRPFALPRPALAVRPLLSATLLLALAACGDDGTPGPAGASGQPGLAALTTVSAEAAGSHCASGGTRIDAGLDTNADRVLDTGEVTSTQYLCHGSSGAAAASGLVRLATEAAGTNCPNGGSRVEAGTDTNGNGVLDTAEVVSTAFVCQGAAGTTGPVGPTGPVGTAGTNSLTNIVAEAAGANCAAGGQKVTSGRDMNTNGVLDTTEVTATAYLCHGARGTSVGWVSTSATSVQAQANTGYALSSSAQATLTLPPSASLQPGDVVRVSGVSSGGWRIAQNAGQSIVTRGLPPRTSSGFVSWTPASAVSAYWRGIDASADGMRLVAAHGAGLGFPVSQVHTSTDAGLTWTASGTARNWSAVASSADGQRLVAAPENTGELHLSTDGGATWTPTGIPEYWRAVTVSADGARIVAAGYGYGIVYSTNGGATWAQSDAPAHGWTRMAASRDNMTLVAVGFGGVYRSVDGGVTWLTTPLSGVSSWNGAAISADGQRMVASGFGIAENVHVSTDAGQTWSVVTSGNNIWSLASSDDGQRLLMASTDGVFESPDGGTTWVSRRPAGAWRSATLSADGTFAIACTNTCERSVDGRTTPGTAGALTGGAYNAIDLQYLGNGLFKPTGFNAISGGFTAQ